MYDVGAITRSFGAMCVIIDVLFFSVTGETNKRLIDIIRRAAVEGEQCAGNFAIDISHDISRDTPEFQAYIVAIIKSLRACKNSPRDGESLLR